MKQTLREVVEALRGLFTPKYRRLKDEYRDAWMKREEARQIEEVRERIERVRDELIQIDQRRAQGNHS